MDVVSYRPLLVDRKTAPEGRKMLESTYRKKAEVQQMLRRQEWTALRQGGGEKVLAFFNRVRALREALRAAGQPGRQGAVPG